MDGDNIILKKKKESCVFCGSTEPIENIKGKAVCRSCIGELLEF
jgi:transcriptional pleiotropic regulator of transition state genes